MSMCQSQSLRAILAQSQILLYGEKSGDIPVYSLHRIATLLRKRPIAISSELGVLLKRAVVMANRIYRKQSGNKWNCLSSSNLVTAVEWTDAEVQKITTFVARLSGLFCSS